MAKEIKCIVKIQVLMEGEWINQEVDDIEDLDNAQRLMRIDEKVRFKFFKRKE